MKRPLCAASAGLVLGILSNQLPGTLQFLFWITLIAMLPIAAICSKKKIKNRMFIMVPLILFAILGFGVIKRYAIIEQEIRSDQMEKRCISGRVVSVREDRLILRLQDSKGCFPFYCTIYTKKPILTGMYIQAEGIPQAYQQATTWGTFDAAAYYQNMGNLFYLQTDRIMILKDAAFIHRLIKDLRSELQQRVKLLLPEEAAAFSNAILFGDKSQLQEDTYQLYSRYGIAHILALSGMHIAIFGVLLQKLLQIWIPSKHAGFLAALLLVFYGFLAGFPISGVRAIFTMLLLYTAKLIRRTADPLTTLAFLTMILLLRQPVMLYQMSFQFSFLAGALLTVCSNMKPITIKEEEGERRPSRITKKVLPGILLQTGLLPLQFWHFYQFSPYSFLLNLLVLSMLSLIFTCLLLAILASFLSLTLGRFFAGIVFWFVKMLHAVLHFAEQLPKAELVMGRPQVVMVVLFAVLFAILLILTKRGRFRLGFLTPVLLLLFLPFHGNEVVLTSIHVGQGDCSIICWKNTCIMIDCGSSDKENVFERIVKPYLSYCGYDHVDAAIISHPDSDHICGILEMLDSGYPVKTVYLSKQSYENETLREELEGVNCQYLQKGETLKTEAFSIACLLPEASDRLEELKDDNELSLLLLLQAGEFTGLFTGDLGSKRLEEALFDLNEVLQGRQLTFLKTPHHGSAFSASRLFYAQMQPAAAVVSVGNNRYGHPSEEVLALLEEYASHSYITKTSGSIRIQIKKKQILLESYCK